MDPILLKMFTDEQPEYTNYQIVSLQFETKNCIDDVEYFLKFFLQQIYDGLYIYLNRKWA